MRINKKIIVPYLYILPALILYGYFILWPIVKSFELSFFDWNGFSPREFVGWANYNRLFSDELFRLALLNNVKLAFIVLIIPIVISLLLTALLTQRNLRGLPLFRLGFFLPYVLSTVVVGIAWRWIFNPNYGLLNQSLTAIGLESLARPWLGDFTFALPAVGIAASWQQFGFYLVIFLAGAQRIDTSLYDAARVDGANTLQEFTHVTLPGIRTELYLVFLLAIINAVRAFDIIWVMTNGGPANRTMVMSYFLYRSAFKLNELGYGAAIAVVQTFIVILVFYLINKNALSPKVDGE